MNCKLLALAATLSLSALTFSAPAAASLNADSSSVVVKYGDLDLASTTGVKNLHARLISAAQTVCRNLDSRVLGLREQHESCVKDAVARSVDKVANANLTNYHRYHALPRALAAN